MFGGLDVGGGDGEGLARILDLQTGDFGDQTQRGLAGQVLLRDAAGQPLVDVKLGEQERRAEPRVAAAQPAVGRRQLADRMRNVRRLAAALVREHLDQRVLAREQEPAPIGRHLAPELALRPLEHERALGAVTRDPLLDLEDAERLPDGGAGDAAFGGEVLDGRDLPALRPLPELDAPPEQAGELDVARDRGAAEVDFRAGAGARRHRGSYSILRPLASLASAARAIGPQRSASLRRSSRYFSAEVSDTTAPCLARPAR